MKRFCSLCIAVLFLYACSEHKDQEIADLKLPQDAMLYVTDQKPQNNAKQIQKLKEVYLAKFFAPFGDLKPNPNIDEVFWIQTSLKKNLGYSHNLEKFDQKDTQSLLQQMQIETYPNAMQKAIITKDTNVRAVPTLKPRFSKPNGYPFDRWQNSLIFYGTPVLITHYDSTKRFAHIQTEFVYGWVEVSDLALIDSAQIKQLEQSKAFVMPNRDDFNLYERNGAFATQARIGKLFVMAGEKQVWGFLRKSDGHLKMIKLPIKTDDFHSFPQAFSQVAVAGYINDLVGQKYGWGGMYEDRDCSAFVRDIYANFGLYLPRNSKAQGEYGTHQIRVEHLTMEEKRKIIIENAQPFATIFWLNGHIMMYIGRDSKGDIMVAHSAWSVQTQDAFGKREHKLGGVVITTLKPGNEFNGYVSRALTLGDRIKVINRLDQELQGF
ncbi:SH3 domain-containing C40 family peptidase [Helicobacter enhydrae]|nr:SH3 domain-containing C40 family peptidase [Helicobacter enhydrae]